MKPDTKVALAAVIVSGLIGIASVAGSIISVQLSNHSAREDQRVRYQQELFRSDKAELRGVLDEAAVNLQRALERAVYTGSIWASRGGEDRLVSRASDQLIARMNHVLASLERLNVRLGQVAPITDHYYDAIQVLQSLQIVFSGRSTRAAIQKRERLYEKLVDARNEYLDAATRIAKSEVGGTRRSP